MANSNTSLQVQLEVEQTALCTGFNITDISGHEDPGGQWGSGNPEISDIDTASLIVKFPNGTEVTLNLLALSGSAFPNDTETPFEITSTMLGLSSTEKLADGVYTITYTVTGNTVNGNDVTAWSSSVTCYRLFTCQTQCCIDKLFGSIKPTDCCNCELLDKVVKAQAFLDAAKKSACCGKSQMATKLLANALFICQSQKCANC